jgi:hypothetical protein
VFGSPYAQGFKHTEVRKFKIMFHRAKAEHHTSKQTDKQHMKVFKIIPIQIV